MAAPRLTREQRLVVLKLIAADYSNAVILHKLAKLNRAGEPSQYERDKQGDLVPLADPFPKLSASALGYYRAKYAEDLELLRKERRAQAMVSGLALKEERIARLCEHADELELIKWVASENGKLWNEKAWRETLADIALEMGERRPVEAGGNEEVVKIYLGIDVEQV